MSRHAVRVKGGDDRPGRLPDRLSARRLLMPRGGRDLARQLLIWMGFAVVHETTSVSQSPPVSR
jgi:hypothetical protein